ncbi:M20/M25/M40 family metallo-hydrolase [Aquibacillus albus]|uniref:Arginine utilization protein RocB n=1 Tax=Aquibacillus albus TaxID=1168171 RepID=A0ABS2MV26_9BACI|nr:M20/M25/M40 family metallo-hydrolase [Aquibacillus albus]MBM7569751.1 arginine utilization protein RocB [Aquibacillus albus]
MKWQSKQELKELLCSLVNFPSITGSESEVTISEYLYSLLTDLEYFKIHPDNVNLHALDDGRKLLTALVKQEAVSETVILLSHFDVVSTDDYGSLKNYAFDPELLTETLLKQIEILPSHVQRDLQNGEWLFGRGTMDMKAGIAVHLSMIEKAIKGEFKGNILMVSVPDEEVESLGMLTALPIVERLQSERELNYIGCINGEPTFSKYPGDDQYYLYTGSIGKVLPGFFCYGKETHVGEPFAGLNANLMVSYLAQEIELNEAFIEKVGDEVTPPPVSLMQRDLKSSYSVQTPTTAVSMYNVLYLKQSIEEIHQKLRIAANKASDLIRDHFQEKAKRFSTYNPAFANRNMDVHVFTYEELYTIAVNRFGEETMRQRQDDLYDESDTNFPLLQLEDLASLCKDLAPMIVLFYSFPFYPSVSSHADCKIKDIVSKVQTYAKDKFKISIEEVEYFPGMSDLSYIGPISSGSDLSIFNKNVPTDGLFERNTDDINSVRVPIINIGPLGRDPHQWTERLELTFSFERLPEILTYTIHCMFD